MGAIHVTHVPFARSLYEPFRQSFHLTSLLRTFFVLLLYFYSLFHGCTNIWVPGNFTSFKKTVDLGIYYSDAHLNFSISTSRIGAFTVLYSHNQHGHVTSVKVFVNIRCFKEWRSFIYAISAPLFDKNNFYTSHMFRSRDSHQSHQDVTTLCQFVLMCSTLNSTHFSANEDMSWLILLCDTLI